jgi:hypothetical protein
MSLKKRFDDNSATVEASYLLEYLCDIHIMSDCNISLSSQNVSALEVVHISQDFEEMRLEHKNCSNEQFLCFLLVYQESVVIRDQPFVSPGKVQHVRSVLLTGYFFGPHCPVCILL